MHDTAEATTTQKSEEELKELASLARLVAYARESARELNAEFSAYCLDLALGALLQDLDRGDVSLSQANVQVRFLPGTRH
ncbi:hypothetical protein GR247_09985 [Rhizobium leguminosarum]|uniref:hypothetical protein n=1 Tax=Rhizobium ruizarguesonis TaxID=2081791 RepID=UPI0003633226|nr:hypothetical protein [Rhizobium ruizarguesonis]NEJ20498.1 hypothetical protein [Rhizobium leguminosarum]NKK55089.1 hypothetical protein [Rhizobium leguminosarum bv. viciae]TAT72619.1 hypothetical protein ELI52_31560 [Rhizobium ruizarguesonis]TAT93311.1 hypothetical protein ELI55_34615 [Rhizobium ruizarguesonis]TAY61243.1 hypothetical protein ELH84_35925 [Rhizobium ruizarguesonis]